MSNYNYKGDLKGFPPEVVEWMLDQQEAQGNRRDVSVFEEGRMADKSEGGFNWDEATFPFMSLESPHKLCDYIIGKRCFDLILHPRLPIKPEPAQTPDFDEHRFQAACAAMGGLLSNPTTMFDSRDQNIANALAHADALLSALKGGDK
jgi:hypothetical protein